MPPRGSTKVPTLPGGNAARGGAKGRGGPVSAHARGGPGMASGGEAPPREPDRTRIQQFGTHFGLLPVWGWTVEALVSALEGHNVGNFQLSGRLAEDMRSHPWIRDALNVRAEFATCCPLNFTPSDGAGRPVAPDRDPRRARGARCADFVREIWPDIMPIATLRDLHAHELLMGQGIFAMDWEERVDGRDRWWIPQVKPWEPSLTAYRQFADPCSIDGGGYVATTLSHGQLRVQPDGGRWGCFTRRTLRPWLGGVVRVLGEAFCGDGYNFRDNMTHQDRWGRGIVKLFHLVGMRQDEINACTASLVEGGGGGVLQCPTTADGKNLIDADLMRADGAGYQTFDATEKRILRRILIALLRQDMTTTGTTGIAENDPRQLSLWKCREEDAATYGDARCTTVWEDVAGQRRPQPVWEACDGPIRRMVTRWIAQFNFGDFDLAPYTWWDATPPDDYERRADGAAKRGQQRAATLQSLGSAIEKLRAQGAKFDAAHLADQCGVSLTVPDEEGNVEPQPMEGPPPQPEGAGPGAAPGAAPGGAGAPAERDLPDVQVRISAMGAAFHPGHGAGVGPGGEVHGKVTAAAKARHEASVHAEEAKKHAFLAGKAASAPEAEHHAGRAEHHAAASKSSAAGAGGHAAHGPAAAGHAAEAATHAADARGHHARHAAADQTAHHAGMAAHHAGLALAAKDRAEAEHHATIAADHATRAEHHATQGGDAARALAAQAAEHAGRADAHAQKLAEPSAPVRDLGLDPPDPNAHRSKVAFFAAKLIDHEQAPMHLRLLAKNARDAYTDAEKADSKRQLLQAYDDWHAGREVPEHYRAAADAPRAASGKKGPGDFRDAGKADEAHYAARETNRDLPPAVEAAAMWYTHRGDGHMNRLLRGHDDEDGAAGKQAAAEIIPLMDAYTRANRLDHDLVLHRGMTLPAEVATKFGEVGNRFVDHGYTSTSASSFVAQQFALDGHAGNPGHVPIVVHVEAPAGTHAAYITPHSHYQGIGLSGNLSESEFLLARGATYTTTHSRRDADGVLHVRVRVETPSHPPAVPKPDTTGVEWEGRHNVLSAARSKRIK